LKNRFCSGHEFVVYFSFALCVLYRNVVYFIEKLVQIVFKKLKNQYHKDLSSKRSFFNRSKMISQPCSIDINTAWFNRAVMDLRPVNTAR